MIPLLECRTHLEFAVIFIDIASVSPVRQPYLPLCRAVVRYPSFCWFLVSISGLTRQSFIAAREVLGFTMPRECGHTSSHPSMCGLGRKRSNFKSLVHSSCARSAPAAVYSPGLNALYLCEIRWWSSSLVWATFFFNARFQERCHRCLDRLAASLELLRSYCRRRVVSELNVQEKSLSWELSPCGTTPECSSRNTRFSV